MKRTVRSVSFVFLCTLPFLGFAAAAVRPLRTSGVYQIVGVVLFVAVLITAWSIGARVIGKAHAERRRLALAGTLFVVPWALIVLLWVGIGAPFQATPTENHMRFLLLLANSILVTGAFVVLKEELSDPGERFYSTLGFAASIPAGVAYLGCMGLISAAYVARLRDGQATSMGLLSDVFDVLEFTACVLTYLATRMPRGSNRRACSGEGRLVRVSSQAGSSYCFS